MRYKDLLIVIVLIALGALVWAKPSLEVAFKQPSLSMTFTPGDNLDSTLIEVDAALRRQPGPERVKHLIQKFSWWLE